MVIIIGFLRIQASEIAFSFIFGTFDTHGSNFLLAITIHHNDRLLMCDTLVKDLFYSII